MSRHRVTRRDSLSASAIEKIDGMCDRFEAELMADKNPSIESYLAGFSGSERVVVFQELLVLEISWRREHGESVIPDDYSKRFSNYLDAIAVSFRRCESHERYDETAELAGVGTDRAEEFLGTERFEVKRRIGRGGMGVVYEALDRERNERLAIKTFRRSDSLYRLKQEFRSLADLVHPNLVRLHELVSLDDRWFIAMELVEGVDFLNYVRFGPRQPSLLSEGSFTTHSESTWPDSDARTEDFFRGKSQAGSNETSTAASRLKEKHTPSATFLSTLQLLRLRRGFGQLCEGVEALHRAGILHRDIKPSNVLVTHTERPGNAYRTCRTARFWVGLRHPTGKRRFFG